MASVNNQIASIQGALSQLGSLGVNLTGGGAVGAANGTTGATPATGATGAAGTTTAAANANRTQQLIGQNAQGQQIAVIKNVAGGSYTLAAPTGREEKVVVPEVDDNGVATGQTRTLLFDATGRHLRNFEAADRKTVRVTLDARQGIATGINNLSQIVAGRQERLKTLSDALAQDASETGTTNQIDLQRLVQEQDVTKNLSDMNHKIYESVQQAIQAWLR